jgi:CHAT domain-containing protein
MREIISPEIGRRDIEGWSEPVNPEVPEVRIEMEAVENSPVATQVQLPESPSTEASAPPAVSDAADVTAIAPRVSASPTTTPNSQTSVTPEAPTRASASAPGAIAPASQPRASANLSVPHIETLRTREFSDSLGVTLPQEALSVVNLRESLAGVARQTNLNPAVVYAIAHPQELQLVVITPDGLPITRSIPAASRSALRGKVTELLSEITNPHKTNTKSYLSAAVQLYQWLIAPIEAELQGRNVDLLMFSLDAGLRGIPLAALHDGEQFLIEKYRLGLIPSVTLTDARYKNLNNSRVLAMGASEFKNPAIERLNAVPLELSFIGEKFKGAEYYLNEEFTPENLRDRRERKSFDIVHLATHVKFSSSGDAPQNRSDDIRGESYIQFWNRPVPFDEIPHLGFQKGTVELLVLSACETAVGNQDAELGFAGLAVKMGVKSVLASLWQVDDDGTLALMSEFYRHLRTQDKTIKAEALRQAQLAMLRGEVTVEEGRLRGTGEELELPPEIAARFGDRRLSHPYFWASFTLIGSPW